MSRATLVRAGGTAAVIGGVLRAAASFAPDLGSDVALQALYFTVDLFLILGLLGFFELRHEDVGLPGASGFLVALVGLQIVRSSRAVPGIDLYPGGALAFTVGLIVLSGAAWKAHTLAGWVPAALVLSLLAGIVAAVLNAPFLFALSGVTFGLAFAGLGLETRSAARPLRTG